MQPFLQQPFLQTLHSYSNSNIKVDVLRLDEVHPIVSGNKWYKLQYYLREALMNKHTAIASFGGAYSNHLVALAYACKSAGLKSIGVVRGEKPQHLSHTLQHAMQYGMQLQFVSREDYCNKKLLAQQLLHQHYIIPEGGYGSLGAKGAATILQAVDTSSYTHIICACGTGTMLAGIAMVALPQQQVLGICVLKGYKNLENDVQEIMDDDKKAKPFSILHQYHFGGYAKHPQTLINFINELQTKENLPTDIVYTSKLFFAVKDLLQQHYFKNGTKVLVIHSGGLQGNGSLNDRV